MNGLDLLIKDLTNKIRAVWQRLQDGAITPNQWYTLTARLLARYAQAALMLGLGRETLTPGDIRVSWELMSGQLEYLDAFRLQIQSAAEFQAGWEARAASYAKAIKVPYWKGKTKMLPLPAIPGDGSSQCLANCYCEWDIKQIDANTYSATWQLGEADHCQTCVQRAKDWKNLIIRDGVLINPYL